MNKEAFLLKTVKCDICKGEFNLESAIHILKHEKVKFVYIKCLHCGHVILSYVIDDKCEQYQYEISLIKSQIQQFVQFEKFNIKNKRIKNSKLEKQHSKMVSKYKSIKNKLKVHMDKLEKDNKQIFYELVNTCKV